MKMNKFNVTAAALAAVASFVGTLSLSNGASAQTRPNNNSSMINKNVTPRLAARPGNGVNRLTARPGNRMDRISVRQGDGMNRQRFGNNRITGVRRDNRLNRNNFSDNRIGVRRGNRGYRNFSYYNGDGYERNYGRRYNSRRGFGIGGISIQLGDIGSSGCRYAYRKWQYTGSRYWRSRYYDCIG